MLTGTGEEGREKKSPCSIELHGASCCISFHISVIAAIYHAARLHICYSGHVRSGIASHHRPSARYQTSKTSGLKHTHSEAQRKHQLGEKLPDPEQGNLVWQWSLCLIRMAPGRSALYWLVLVVGARSSPSDSNICYSERRPGQTWHSTSHFSSSCGCRLCDCCPPLETSTT